MNNEASGSPATDESTGIPFRWTFIWLPLACTVITIILVAVFYGMLPEEVSYRFQESSPDTFVTRNTMIAWLIIPQVLLTFLSWTLVRIVLLASRHWDTDSIIPQVLPLIGNMTGLAQIIIVFAALQIFLYNANEILLGPFWVLVVIVLVFGGIILGTRFIGLLRQARRQLPKESQEK